MSDIDAPLPATSLEDWKARELSERQARSAKAQSLVTFAGTTLVKLRILTVICAEDHTLVKVYRIKGELVWKGSWTRHTVTRSTPWEDPDQACSEGIIHSGAKHDVPIRYSKRSPQVRFVIVDLFDDLAGSGNGPLGTCPCGVFAVSSEWLAQQIGRDDLPASRRVVLEPAPGGELH